MTKLNKNYKTWDHFERPKSRAPLGIKLTKIGIRKDIKPIYVFKVNENQCLNLKRTQGEYFKE